MALRQPAAPLPLALLRIEKDHQVRHIWPVHLPGWLAAGWSLSQGDDLGHLPQPVAIAAQAPLVARPEAMASAPGLRAAQATVASAESVAAPASAEGPEPELELESGVLAPQEPPATPEPPAPSSKGRRGRPRKGSAAPEPVPAEPANSPELETGPEPEAPAEGTGAATGAAGEQSPQISPEPDTAEAISGAEPLALPDDLFSDAF